MTGHLIHIGYPKAGSNFLRRWFAGHPQLAYVEGGIAGFRSVYDVVTEGAKPRPGIRCRVTSSEGLSAPHPDSGSLGIDYNPGYDFDAAQTEVCERLAALFGSAQVLIVTRGFRSMILSSFSQYARTGGDIPFEEQLATGRFESAPWNYDALIARYAKAFGEQNVIVLPWELLRDDAAAFTRVLEERLGLDHFAGSPARLNPSLSPVELYWYPRLTRRLRALPIGPRLRALYVRGAFRNRFRWPIAVLQRLRPGAPVTADAIPDRVLETFRGKAESLRANPLYAPYARDYLHL